MTACAPDCPHANACGNFGRCLGFGSTSKETPMSDNPAPSYLVIVPAHAVDRLVAWMTKPNGSHVVNERLTLEAIEGGRIMVKTAPYQEPKPTPRGV